MPKSVLRYELDKVRSLDLEPWGFNRGLTGFWYGLPVYVIYMVKVKLPHLEVPYPLTNGGQQLRHASGRCPGYHPSVTSI